MPPLIKMLHRDPATYTQEKSGAPTPTFRNPDPVLHPFERAKELTRAVVAAKMDRMFAKPFVKALEGHADGVPTLCKFKASASLIASGACDGEIRIWDMAQLHCWRRFHAHQGFVRGICMSHNDEFLFSCGDDKVVRQWQVRSRDLSKRIESASGGSIEALKTDERVAHGHAAVSMLQPVHTFRATSALLSIDHHWKKPLLVTSGDTVDVYDHHRSAPVHSFEWGCDRIFRVRFNPAEACLIGACSSDRAVALYDLRASSAIRKVTLNRNCAAFAWNPQQPMNFVVGSEDANLYTFDMRRFEQAVMVHKDHIGPVLDVEFAPTGHEFVSGSYDRTIRIWPADQGRSREVYHGKRMQRVLSCTFSADARMVLSGSEDGNVRVWKSHASEKLGSLSHREKEAQAYRAKLIERWGHVGDVRKISKHRHVPKYIKSTKAKHTEMRAAKKKREDNRRKHSKPGSVPVIKERSRFFVDEQR